MTAKNKNRRNLVILAGMLLIIVFGSDISGLSVLAGMPPKLHTEGRWIVEEDGSVWIPYGSWWSQGFEDTCSGYWNPSNPYHWDPAAASFYMDKMVEYGFNHFSIFFWVDWWLEDAAITLGGYATDSHYRQAFKDTLTMAASKGLYVQVRMYGVTAPNFKDPKPNSGRKEMPIPPWDTSVFQSGDDFTQFWVDFALEINAPNIIYCLYDEPTGSRQGWFDLAGQTIAAMRVAGIDNIILNHLGYGGNIGDWITQWVGQGLPTENIVFSTHIYRAHGTFNDDFDSPTDEAYIMEQLGDNVYPHRGLLYVTETLKLPVWVSAIGAFNGHTTNDAEYTCFVNTLAVLNRWQLGYTQMHFLAQTTPVWTGFNKDGSPNRVGQALIDAIAGTSTPATYLFPRFTTLTQTVNTELKAGQKPYIKTREIGGPAGVEVTALEFSESTRRLSFTVDGSNVADLQVYCGVYGEPGSVSNAVLKSYDSDSQVATVTVTFSSPVNVLLEWNETDDGGDDGGSTGGGGTLSYVLDVECNIHNLQFTVDSSICSTPYTATFAAGSHTVRMPAEVSVDGVDYVFASWEDGGTSPERTVQLQADTSLVAVYEPEGTVEGWLDQIIMWLNSLLEEISRIIANLRS